VLVETGELQLAACDVDRGNCNRGGTERALIRPPRARAAAAVRMMPRRNAIVAVAAMLQAEVQL
jgi:hypothetical protein